MSTDAPDSLPEMFKMIDSLAGTNLSAGNEKRTSLAKEYAKLDAPILNKKEEELRPLYVELAFNIATDSLLDKCFSGCTAEQRWAMVEPFTWFK